MKEYKRQYREKNREKVRAYGNKWRAENIDAARAHAKKSYFKHSDTRNADSRERYAENATVKIAYQLKYKKQNRDKTNLDCANRRAAKLQATPAWANHEKIAEFYFAADFLGMVTGEWYHVDHIVPLQSDLVCGLHWEGNLQVLTARENLRKKNSTWPDMPC